MNGNNNQKENGTSGASTVDKSSSGDVRLEDTQCGCPPSCAPPWAQRLSNPKVFTAHMSVVLSVMLVAGMFIGGVLTTIERNFQLDSSESGSVVFSSDIVSTVLVVPLSYYGQRGHRARWIAGGMMLAALGNLLCAVPHFISDPINPQELLTGTDDVTVDNDICDVNGVYQYSPGASNGTNGSMHGDDDGNADSGNLRSVWWIILGQIIIGIGTAPFYPLVTTYIDDSVKKHNLTAYTALLFMGFTIGPACGFLLAAYTTSKYVDFDRVLPEEIPEISQRDPRWIGAWWLGFVMLGVIIFVLALPVFFYPRTMASHRSRQKEEVELNENNAANANEFSGEKFEEGALREQRGTDYSNMEGGTVDVIIKGPLLALKRLFLNVTNVLLLLFGTTFMANIALFVAFGLKYMQTQYGLSPSKAALYSAVMLGPTNIISQIFSGYFCRRFKLNMKQCTMFALIGLGLSSVVVPLTMLVGCENTPIAGVSSTYGGIQTFETTPRDVCNADCACPDEVFQPVCGSNGLTYLSPCHAGCTDVMPDPSNSTMGNPFSKRTYQNCGCIANNNDSTTHAHFTHNSNNSSPEQIGEAFTGQCPSMCNGIKAFVILFSLNFFLMYTSQNPVMYVSIRCVDEEDRSIAIGLKGAFGKIFGFFLTPVYFGAIINSVCIHWQFVGGERGACWLYDGDGFRYAYIGILTGLKALSLFFLILTYFSIKEPLFNSSRGDEKENGGYQGLPPTGE